MWTEADGDILFRWLFQLVMLMAVIAFVGYEAISIAVTHLTLDEDARQVAVATRSAYRDGRDVDEATDAGLAEAEEQGIKVLDVTTTGDDQALVFELERTASTLLVHRIGWLDGLSVARASRSVPLSP